MCVCVCLFFIFQFLPPRALTYTHIKIVRLQSRKAQGCGTFLSCKNPIISPSSNSHGLGRLYYWFTLYCPGTYDSSIGESCLSSQLFLCFTSRDSNWSLNAVMVKRENINNHKYNLGGGEGEQTLSEMGRSQWEFQDGFESTMIYSKNPWMNWNVPICLSYEGLFIQEGN